MLVGQVDAVWDVRSCCTACTVNLATMHLIAQAIVQFPNASGMCVQGARQVCGILCSNMVVYQINGHVGHVHSTADTRRQILSGEVAQIREDLGFEPVQMTESV